MAALAVFCSLPLAALSPMPKPVANRLNPAAPTTPARGWRLEEDWALTDGADAYTVGQGENCVTFWNDLAASNAALSRFSGSDLEARAAEIEAPFGKEPKRLESAMRLPDGRWTGTVDGRTVWMHVVLHGRMRCDAEYVETLGGRVYALTRPSTPQSDSLRGVKLSGRGGLAAGLATVAHRTSRLASRWVAGAARGPYIWAAQGSVQRDWDSTDLYLSVVYATTLLIGAELVALAI